MAAASRNLRPCDPGSEGLLAAGRVWTLRGREVFIFAPLESRALSPGSPPGW